MAERVQILVGKLNDCANEVSDKEVSQHLRKMQRAFDLQVRNSLFGDTEWKRDIDVSAAKVYSNIIDLVQEVEDFTDSYYLLVSIEQQRYGKTISSNNEMREISAKMREFLREEKEFLSRIVVFFWDTTPDFLDLLKKFSEKVCKEYTELAMDLWQKSEQPGSKPEPKDNEILLESTKPEGIIRKSVQPRCVKNHITRQGGVRQEVAKMSRSKRSISLPSQGRKCSSVRNINLKSSDGWENILIHIDHSTQELQRLVGREKEVSKLQKTRIEKWSSERNITVESYDGWEIIPSQIDHSNPELQRLVGREKEIRKLQLFCAHKKSDPLAIAVTGVAGIGKTSIVEAVYKKVKRQFDCYAWVDAFERSTSDILLDMLNLFSKKQSMSSPCNASTMDECSLRKTLRSFLTTKKYLLVLDDISSEADWTSVKEAFPAQHNCNGKVVLTSRLLNFSGCKNIKLEPLNAEDSYNLLFKQQALSHEPSSAEKSTAEEISKLCHGNPLTIRIIRSMLSLEKSWPLIEMHKKLKNVRSANKRNKARSTNRKQRGEVNDFVPLCYSALRPMLKSCFLYGALFPPRSKIPCRKLIRLWVAEGFIDGKNNDMTMEEAGELQLHELLGRNMFQVAKIGVDGKPKSCRVLRPLQEFADKRARQDRFCHTSETGISLPPERLLRLSLTARQSNSNMNVIDKNYQSRLRSLLLLKGENLQASQMKYDSLSSFKLLCLLDLQGVPIKILPDSVGKLCLLQYLGLRRTELIELPRSIGRLKRLQTLDIRDTFMRDLPQDLEQLNKLRHLLLASSFDDNVVNLPIDIASFKDLQTLAGVKLTKRIGENLMELPQLQKLSVGKVKSNLLNQLAISINSMESLCSLTIKCDLGEQIHARLFESFTKIRTLRVEGEVLDLFDWVKNIKSLTHLDLRGCVLTHDPFVALENLFNLVCLSLQNAYVGESIRFQKDGFPSLKKLSIAHFQALSQWYMDDNALENLEKLTIGSCPKLTHLPPYFRKLANLRVMQVTKMPEAFMKEARQLGEEIAELSVVVHGLSEAQFHSSTISIRNNWHNRP